MAVVTSGSETIVRYSRGLVGIYYALMVAAGIIALLSLIVALGTAAEPGSWIGKAWSIISWTLGALAFAGMAYQLYSTGQVYEQTYVAISAEGVRIHLPATIRLERRFEWDKISGITYEHNVRQRVCRFTAGDFSYKLTQNNCPSPGKVAELMAKRKGVPLTAPEGAA